MHVSAFNCSKAAQEENKDLDSVVSKSFWLSVLFEGSRPSENLEF